MTTQSITTRTRMLIQDTGRPFACNVVANGFTTLFDLPVVSISQTANPPAVYIGGILTPNPSTPIYFIDYKFGQILFFEAPMEGTTISVSGWTYDFFDDDEVAQAVTDGFNFHVQDQDPLPVIDPALGQCSIPNAEEYLVSILSARELLWFRTTDASQQIDIHTPEGVSITRSQRWEQMLKQIASLENEYKELSLALGVGVYRIQVLNQRRVSYTTNRLVPIFRDQEYNTPYSGFFPTAAPVGAIITIWGRYLTSTTQVTFGGVPSTEINVISDFELKAVVPPGAITGQIGITTPTGEVLSTAQFVIGEPAPFLSYGPELVDIPIPPGK